MGVKGAYAMNTYRFLRLREYTLELVDRRTGEQITETVVYERDADRILSCFDMDLTDAITRQYTRKGFYVKSITKGAARTCRVDLAALYAASGEAEG